MEKTSGTLIPIILWMSLLLGLAIPAHAFFPPRVDVSHNPELSANLGKVLGNHWFERKRRILTGEDRLGTKELDAIYQAQLDRGIRNIPQRNQSRRHIPYVLLLQRKRMSRNIHRWKNMDRRH